MNRLDPLFSISAPKTPILRQDFNSLHSEEQCSILDKFHRGYQEYAREDGPMDQAMRDSRNTEIHLRHSFIHNFLFQERITQSVEKFSNLYDQYIAQKIQDRKSNQAREVIEVSPHMSTNDIWDDAQLAMNFYGNPESLRLRATTHSQVFLEILNRMKTLRTKYNSFPYYNAQWVQQGFYDPFSDRALPYIEAKKLIDILTREWIDLETSEIIELVSLLERFDATRKPEILL